MEQVSFFKNNEIEEIERIYRTGTNKAWQGAIEYYIENQLGHIIGKWPSPQNCNKPASTALKL
jgi:hypothetical protein